jgi:hypothetical protein
MELKVQNTEALRRLIYIGADTEGKVPGDVIAKYRSRATGLAGSCFIRVTIEAEEV